MRNLYSKLKCGGGVSFYLLKNKKAFTLVEMMVVVVIISILATIWFLRLGNYSSEANVAKRASDKKNIEQVLEMYKSKEWDYPEFEEENGEKIFWTWTWEKVKNRLPVMPVDPITKKPYKIAFLPSWKYGKIAMVDLDGEIAKANPENTKNILPETEATNQLDLTALIAIQGKVAEKLRELVWLDKTASENNFVQSVNGKVQESNALVHKVTKMITEKDFEETKVNSTRDEINNKKRELTDLLEQIESKINKFKWDAELTAKRNELTVDDLIALQRTLWEKQRELSSLDSWNSLIVKAGNETNKSNNLVQKILNKKSKPDLTLAEANNLLSEKAAMKTNLEWVIRELETEINRINTQRQQALENAKNAAREEIERIAREEIGKVNTSGLSQSEKTDLIDRINTAKTTAIWNINRANSESSVTQAKNTWAEEIRKIYRDHNAAKERERQQALTNAKNTAKQEIERIAREEIGKVNASGWSQSEKANLINSIDTAKATAIWNINRANSESSVTQAKNTWAEEIRKIYRDFNTARELEIEKTKLRNRITVLEKVNKTGKTAESVNAFNTKVNSAKTLLNKTWVTKQEITNKINELNGLENTLVNAESPFSPNWKIYIWEPHKDTCDRKSYDRFVVTGDVIRDNRTGLVWSKEIKNTGVKWEQAKQYCENLTTWWKTNWRLPDITELNSILNDTCITLATYEEFNIVGSNIYWSSTTYANSAGDAWVLYFYRGSTHVNDKVGNSHYVLCVAK